MLLYIIAKRKRGKVVDMLPARDWAVIYRKLKPLLRPCGDLGEGRLDFYHRSLSKAVRKKYFSCDDENEKIRDGLQRFHLSRHDKRGAF